jgi:ATP-dependent Zn protease
LTDNREALNAVIASLLEHETISGEDLAIIVQPFRQPEPVRDHQPV